MLNRYFLALAAVCSLSISASSCASDTNSQILAQAEGEILRGEKLANGVIAFRGLPYAQPPTGALRWRGPLPHRPRSGEQDATKFGPACPQDQGNPEWYRDVARAFDASGDVVAPLEDISEDCLSLNIWTPGMKAEAGRPVMVWIHGGSNVNGWAYEPNYLGHRLAEKGVVVVSFNYRLGPLGFLSHPALSAEDPDDVSGYYGLLDQIAALEWIARNINIFGGDPTNVTVFGESAGGGDIAALMRMEKARGLFQRAIIQSGAIGPFDSATLQSALAAGEALMASLEAKTTEAMRDLDWRTLVAKRPEVLPDYYFAPVEDGVHLKSVGSAISTPLLIGANRDEWLMYLPDNVAATYQDALEKYAGENSNAADTYLSENFTTAAQRANRLISAAEFLCPSLALADAVNNAGQPAYAYYFTRVRPGGDELLAYHGAEIPYVFDTADNWLPGDEKDRALADAMMVYWTNFATRGDPSDPSLPRWEAYSDNDRWIMELGDRIGRADSAPDTICSYLNSPE